MGNNEKDTVTFKWPSAGAYELKISAFKTLLTWYTLDISFKFLQLRKIGLTLRST
jgi:hypothetical protein